MNSRVFNCRPIFPFTYLLYLRFDSHSFHLPNFLQFQKFLTPLSNTVGLILPSLSLSLSLTHTHTHPHTHTPLHSLSQLLSLFHSLNYILSLSLTQPQKLPLPLRYILSLRHTIWAPAKRLMYRTLRRHDRDGGIAKRSRVIGKPGEKKAAEEVRAGEVEEVEFSVVNLLSSNRAEVNIVARGTASTTTTTTSVTTTTTSIKGGDS